MDNKELKPCPFCGGTDLSIETNSVQPDDFHDAYVYCVDCDAQGRHAMTLEGWLSSKDEAKVEAVVAWNRRAPAPQAAQIDLHNAIMNLPCKMGRAVEMNGATKQAYKEGHRDARHAAAELAAAAESATSPAPAVVQMTPSQRYGLKQCFDIGIEKGLITTDTAYAILSASGVQHG